MQTVRSFKTLFNKNTLTAEGTHTEPALSPNPPWSKEAIISLVAIFVTLILFVLGLLSGHLIKRLILLCFGRKSQADPEGITPVLHTRRSNRLIT
jgi:hypothetical protein